MLGLNPTILIVLLLAFIGSNAVTGYKAHQIGVERTTLAYETKLQDQRDEAAALLQKSKDDVIAAERRHYAFAAEVGKKHAEDQTRINGLRIANGRLVAAAGGLFDRNGRPRGEGGGDVVPRDPTGAGAAERPAAGCRLSDQVTADLLDLARDADAAAAYARAGHEYAVGLPRGP